MTVNPSIFQKQQTVLFESLEIMQRSLANSGKSQVSLIPQCSESSIIQSTNIRDKAELSQASFWELTMDKKKSQSVESRKPKLRNRKKAKIGIGQYKIETDILYKYQS